MFQTTNHLKDGDVTRWIVEPTTYEDQPPMRMWFSEQQEDQINKCQLSLLAGSNRTNVCWLNDIILDRW